MLIDPPKFSFGNGVHPHNMCRSLDPRILSIVLFCMYAILAHAATDETLWVIQRHDNTSISLFQTKPRSDIQKWITVFQVQQDTGAIQTVLEKFYLPSHEEQETYITLGDSLMRQAQYDDARIAYHAAATGARYAGSQRAAHAYFCLGVALIQVGDLTQAAHAFRQAIGIAPDFFLPVYYLGSLSILIGDVEDGLHFYRSAEQLLNIPDRAMGAGDSRAVAPEMLPQVFFQHLMQVFSTNSMKLSMVKLQQDLSQLVRHYHMLDLSQLHVHLAMALLNFGAFDEAMRHIQLVTGTGKEHVWLRAYAVFSTPVVYNTMEEGYSHRAKLVEQVRQALHEQHALGDPAELRDLAHLFHAVAYLGVPSHQLMVDVALMFTLSTPHTVSVAPWLTSHRMHTASMQRLAFGYSGERSAFSRRVREHNERIVTPTEIPTPAPSFTRPVRPRIGIVSYNLFNHPMGWLISNLVQMLSSFQGSNVPRNTNSKLSQAVRGAGHHVAGPNTVPAGVQSFNVTIFRLNSLRDELTDLLLQSASQVVNVERDSTNNRNSSYLQQMISQQQLDALIVLDEGYDPLLFGILQARMAPVQLVYRGAQGHMQSTGMPNTVDYWLTGDRNTPRAAQSWMNEQLVRVGSVGDHLTWSRLPTSEQHLHVASKHHLMQHTTHYLIASGLAAVSPPMDELLVQILAMDPAGMVLILHEPNQKLWAHKLKIRIGRKLRAANIATRRLRLLHAGPPTELPSLLNAVSVVVDSFPVGLGRDAFTALSVGTPVVTCTACAQYSRSTASALLHLANYSQLIAATVQEIAPLAVQTAAAWTTSNKTQLRFATCSCLAWNDRHARPDCGNISKTIDLRDQSQHIDQRSGTLVDWAQLLGRASAPWARLRQRASSRRHRQ